MTIDEQSVRAMNPSLTLRLALLTRGVESTVAAASVVGLLPPAEGLFVDGGLPHAPSTPPSGRRRRHHPGQAEKRSSVHGRQS